MIMDIKDLRIGDIVDVKALKYNDDYMYHVASINYYGIIDVDTGGNSPIDYLNVWVAYMTIKRWNIYLCSKVV